MELNQNQKQAVEYLDGPLLVLAGPGTGKTQLLSQRVAHILKTTDANPDNILCLTFTDVGAANMRERLKSIIGRDGMKVNIGTYHAFGSQILAQYRNYNENYDRRLDSALDDVTTFKIIKTLRDALPATDILRGDKIKDIKDTISDAKKARLTPDDLAKVAEQNVEDSRQISQEVSPLLKQVVKGKYQASLDAAYLPIAEILAAYLDCGPIMPGVMRWGKIVAEALNDALELAAEKNSVAPLTDWRNEYFEQDGRGNYRLKDRIANKKLISFVKIMRQYEEYLHENALFDYDDMIEEAVMALEKDAGFRATLQERYQYIMLDEFQDTNPSQFAIVKALTGYEKPMVMAVGDDDQAIYEFQGALASNMKDFQEYYDAKVIPLVENYRSTQEILDFSEKIIAQAPDKKFETKKLIAHKPAPNKSQIYRYEFGGADAEYGFIAGKINELIESGVRQSEIAVITRKNKYFEPLLPYLKDYEKIKIAYEKRDNLFEDEKMHEIFTMAQYVWELANDKKPTVQLMEVLSFRCFEVPALEMVKLNMTARREHRSLLDYSTENGSDAVKEAVQYLADLAAKSFTEPLADLLFEIADKMRPSEMGEYERFGFYENIASLMGKLKNHFGEKKLRLGDMVEMLNDYMEAEMPLNTTSPYKDADDAVQLMTVHGAKGLEFEYVFIVSVDDKAWGGAKGNNNFLSLPKNLMQIRHTGITDSERLRVMYVALTRAKHTLILTNSVRDFTGATPARLEYFEEHEAKDDEGNDYVAAPLIPAGKVVQLQPSQDLAVRETNVKNWVQTHYVENPDMRAMLCDQMKGFRLSASALNSFVNIIYAGPKDFYEKYVLKTEFGPDTWQLVFGNLMHATFEKVAKEGLSDEEATEYYLSELENYDTTEEIRRLCREKGPESLVLSLTEFGDVVRRGKAEVSFGAENIVVGGVPVGGKIDLMVVDNDAKTIEVYDYKTGAYHDGRWTAEPSLFDHAMQLEFYRLLLNNSREYRNYRVTRGHILYVAADRDNEVHDKVYEFGDTIQFYSRNKLDFEFKLTDLIVALYPMMTSLSFVNDPEIFIDSDKQRTMPKVREFIKLLLAKASEK